ncbi:unnamed protein product [Fusarium venenatum]|uniref:Uncharacterized protein n=1 Tax=Fusarium venenatum TaxID=56646 RepID=A0A2L2T8I7_9HYPO|nr:uncharacterized protein FVRRES_03726 [Fusarium venenatum]CEI67214.1 unnamed protein product [Fusarium venenatum]
MAMFSSNTFSCSLALERETRPGVSGSMPGGQSGCPGSTWAIFDLAFRVPEQKLSNSGVEKALQTDLLRVRFVPGDTEARISVAFLAQVAPQDFVRANYTVLIGNRVVNVTLGGQSCCILLEVPSVNKSVVRVPLMEDTPVYFFLLVRSPKSTDGLDLSVKFLRTLDNDAMVAGQVKVYAKTGQLEGGNQGADGHSGGVELLHRTVPFAGSACSESTSCEYQELPA